MKHDLSSKPRAEQENPRDKSRTTTRLLTAALACALATILAGCTQQRREAAADPIRRPPTQLAPSPAEGVERLAQLLTGSFSSSDQATANPDDYMDVRLRVVPIWEGRDASSRWLYVEQAAAASLDRPYRQRIYRVFCAGKEGWANTVGDKDWCVRWPDIENDFSRPLYCSEVHTLPGDPLVYAGAGAGEAAANSAARLAALESLSPSDLTRRNGCEVYLLEREPGIFVGGTRGNACTSELRDASYATSTVTIARWGIESWDQGFDASGSQVWGATKGGYHFLRE